MTDDPVERVARAICCPYGGGCPTGNCNALKIYGTKALAAIRALREPTEGMLDKGACYEERSELHASVFDDGDMSRDIWQAMIDAALEGHGEKS